MKVLCWVVVGMWLCLKGCEAQDDEFLYDVFPKGFQWGVATSAYQIEGAWNTYGKGPNIWDTWAHENNGSNIVDGKNGDVACDSYHKYLEDVQLLKDMGANVYRFSISWARISPNGSASDTINREGIDYYNKLIDALIENGITPQIVMHIWDLPQGLQDRGGWPNEELAEEFAAYSRILFTEFGDRVKNWATFNEPYTVCQLGYAYGLMAPGIVDPAEKPYQCGHTILKAHGLAYRIYEREFKAEQGGEVGIILSSDWAQPKDPLDPTHVEASHRSLTFIFGWFAYPLYRGEYHPIMRQLIDAKSEAEGRNTSRLPSFDAEWSNIINGTMDFIGLNHYTTTYIFPTEGGEPGSEGDSNTGSEVDPSWEETAAPWLRLVPWGLRKLVNWIGKEYPGPPIYITENGSSDYETDGVNDQQKVRCFRDYINELLKAVKLDGVDVRGYTAWTLLDNFEWAAGYTQRFGIHYINFTDPNLTRVPKDSAIFLTKVFADNGFPNATSV